MAPTSTRAAKNKAFEEDSAKDKKRRKVDTGSEKSASESEDEGEPSLKDILKCMKRGQKKLSQDLNNLSKNFQDQITKVTESVIELQERVTNVEANLGNTNLSDAQLWELEKIQIESRKLYLIIVGLIDIENETETNLIERVLTLFREDLEVSEVFVDNAYRVGKSINGSRNIIVRFFGLSDRNKVFYARKKLRDKDIPVFINEDLPPQTFKRRKLLRSECKKASDLGKKTRLLGDKLWIDNIAYVVNSDEKLIQLKPNTRTSKAYGNPNPISSGVSTSRNIVLRQQKKTKMPVPPPFTATTALPRSPPGSPI